MFEIAFLPIFSVLGEMTGAPVPSPASCWHQRRFLRQLWPSELSSKPHRFQRTTREAGSEAQVRTAEEAVPVD